MVWDTIYQTDYKSKKQAARHAERDSTALASVALPAHYSAIYAVLDSLKHRLEDKLQLKHVVEWGSGVGSGLWCAQHFIFYFFLLETDAVIGLQCMHSAT